MMNSKPVTFKFMIHYSIFVTMGLFACSGTMAEDFVPFVIPAQPNPDSPIAYPSSQPIKTNSDHLVAKGGHFYRGEHRVRLWGVNLSFGANLPRREDAPHIAARLAAAGVNTVTILLPNWPATEYVSTSTCTSGACIASFLAYPKPIANTIKSRTSSRLS
jgi:hypothetical protein